MKIDYRIPFGDLKIGKSARQRIVEVLDSNWVSEGRFVREFEEKFAEKFNWKHAIATSSGTDAGIVVWSAVNELTSGRIMETSDEDHDFVKTKYIMTPACAFVATANCILASGMIPWFIDVELETLNLSSTLLASKFQSHFAEIELGDITGIQFVATMGKPTPIKEIAKIAENHDLYLIGDFCEAHGAQFIGRCSLPGYHTMAYADHICDASIYSLYAAHLIVGGEGGIICTDDDELAELCRSIKSHGRPAGSAEFQFINIGCNAKWNELCSAIALEGLEKFDETFRRRQELRAMFIEKLRPLEDLFVLYDDGPGEIISPHAFPLVYRDEAAEVMPLRHHLERAGIQTKSLFGSLPTDHGAFSFLGHKKGDFPVAEHIGRTGLHWGCHEHMTDEDVEYVCAVIREFHGR